MLQPLCSIGYYPYATLEMATSPLIYYPYQQSNGLLLYWVRKVSFDYSQEV